MLGQSFSDVTLALFLLYVSITLVVTFQICRIIYNKHRKVAFRFGFLLLGFFWGLIRAIFWGTFYRWEGNLTSSILYWIPVNIQFATYALLVLFYAHVVHRNSWERITKKRFTIAYAAVNIILLILQCIWIGIDYRYIENPNLNQPAWINQIQFVLTGIVFLILVSILAFYGWKLSHEIKSTKNALQSQLPLSIIPITFVIFLCFTSRCIYNFVSAFGNVSIDLDSKSGKDISIILLSYLMWEILPYILILVLFWRIPSTQIGGLNRRQKQQNQLIYPALAGQSQVRGNVPAINQSHQPPGALARLFLDPQRYDSDDETTNLLYKGSPSMYNGTRNSPYSTTPIMEDPHHQSHQHNQQQKDKDISPSYYQP
ncbi:hypothetical protein DFA_05620 [Cavenderia fasciculata]|uniref:THH1/TOM1/TOM3 domain-containing protein n=1 Tax=Cavenderia fasciculata TaxID=261658 RepID=F4PLR5_CACFS|nr:uncharacterized protein DFA_05620 [Cavenderia fasciculata]EGG23487.1 hypothetical protein DFA_05620 [Cavenderia fasciculata]|eukprot:XP_004361338.1 hypothetical protein DFA_05620 [Cavenderia fasciculata]